MRYHEGREGERLSSRGVAMRVPGFFWLALTSVALACGGSSTGGQPQDPAPLIQKACNKAVALQCQNGPTPQQCTNSMNENLSQAKAKGCVSQFDAVVECLADKHTDCAQDPGFLCTSQFQALDSCEGSSTGDGCSGGVGGPPPGAPPYYQNCGISCSTWSVQCETKTSPTLVCTCTAGPKAGTTFSPSSCKDLTSTFAAQYCQG